MEAVRIPPLSDHNAWADFWYYEVGVNVIPADTRKKKTFMEWKRWQTESIPEELHDQWKRENKFADGLAIILGKVWRGEHIDEYLIFIDCDNLKAIEGFCTRNGMTATLKQIAEKFIVEQHPDDTSKAHIFFYSEIPFTKKSSDINVIDDPRKFKEDQIPAFEIKGRGTHGIAYCTPSIHKNGERYQILGTPMPIKLSEDQANQMMQHIDSICKKYRLQYLENDNGNGNTLTPITDLFKDGFAVVEGHNRHLVLLRIMDSLISRNYAVLSLDKIERDAYEWNQEHCKPPLDDSECEKLWQEATKFIESQIKKDASAAAVAKKEEEQQQPSQQPEPLPEELTKEVSWKEISDILSTSIKKDEVPKLITFCGMLLAQTNEDQLNIGFQAESSAGKSYIPIEVVSYFPKGEVEIIVSASPTSFYHDGGTWDNDRKVLIKDLEHKNLIFLDMPHFQLLEKLRPMLSNDMKELHYKITDKNQKFGLRTKNVIIRGYPSVFFCTAKTDPDEQEKTRMLLLSPSTDQEKLRESLELASLRKGNPEEYRNRISQSWVADTWTYIDDLVTDPTNGDLESIAGMLFGAKAASLANEGKFEKAIMCIQSESEPEIGGSVICNIERTTGIVIISKYEDLETIPLFQQIVGLGRNISVDDLVAYHFKLKSENPFARTWGFDCQIRNMTDMQVNLTDATTNQTITTIPAKFVEYTHSDNTHQQLGKAPDLTHMLFVLYNDIETGEVTGYDIEFKTAKYNDANFPVPGMFMQQFFLAGELKEIFNSFAIVKASTGTTTTDLTTSTEDSTNGEEGSETATTATSTTTQEEEGGGDSECDSSYPDDCIPPSPPDLNCDDDGVPENFQVVGSDPHGFDGDNDGIGCETGNNQPDVGEEEEDDGGDAADNDGGDGADEDGGNADEGEGGGEGNDPNEFEGCIVPPGRDPSDAGC